ncbi:MAG TPA: XRE family transcriptional regulator [Nocardioidaceae bacterium]|nr:XRE family transcriptional regulator [Nocardioidaceae bacterium]
MTGSSTDTVGLGIRLRHARVAQRRSLAEVAASSGITKGYLSKLENGQANASVAALMRVCESLHVPVGTLFDPEPGSVVRADDYPPIEFGGERMREYVLTPRTERRLQALVSEIDPGGGSGSETHTLPTDVEFAFVLDGCLRIDVCESGSGDETTVVLNASDAFTFPAQNSHRFEAIATDRPTKVLWILSPALDTGQPTEEDTP